MRPRAEASLYVAVANWPASRLISANHSAIAQAALDDKLLLEKQVTVGHDDGLSAIRVLGD